MALPRHFAGGIFKLELYLPDDYPMCPPVCGVAWGICLPKLAPVIRIAATPVCLLLPRLNCAAEGALLDEDLPPQCGQARPHLPRHPQGQV